MPTPTPRPARTGLDRKQYVTAQAILSGFEPADGCACKLVGLQQPRGWRLLVHLYPAPVGGEQGFDGITYEITDVPDDDTLAQLELASQQVMDAAWDETAAGRAPLGGNGLIPALDVSRMGRDD